jgi:LPXTG-site transpeptidase (sortase) family protein
MRAAVDRSATPVTARRAGTHPAIKARGRVLAAIAIVAVALVALSVLAITALSQQRGPALPPPSAARPLPPTPTVSVRPLRASVPTRLEIPKIGVKTSLMPLGLNSDHSLQVPPLSRAQEAGWYRYGPTPGAKGAAVIAGHVDTTRGPAVFFRLGRLRPGDVIRVHRQDGTTAEFRVDSAETASKNDFPTQKVYGRVGYAALRLITCGGPFDRGSGHYTDNIVVYAHLAAA